MAGKYFMSAVFSSCKYILFVVDYLEDQNSELETLHCIYTEGELTEIGNNPTCFQVHVEPAIIDEESCSGKWKSPVYTNTVAQSIFTVSVDIQFTYPPKYPEEVPGLEIVDQIGLSPEQVTELETYLNEQVFNFILTWFKQSVFQPTFSTFSSQTLCIKIEVYLEQTF